MADLAVRLPPVGESRMVLVAYGFVAVGLGIKMALFPFHGWLPGAYGFAPTPVSALLAGTATKVAVYAFVRFFFSVSGADTFTQGLNLDKVLLVTGVAGVLFGSAVAMFQSDIKRLLAFSSIAQVGYMGVGIGLASGPGLTAATVHLANHGFTKAALFMAVGAAAHRVGATNVASMTGLGRRMPWTMAAFVVAGLSLVGVPLTAGFITKWYLVQASLGAGIWPVAVVVVAASIMALVCVWRVVEVAYFGQPDEHSLQARAREAPWSMLVPLWACVLVCVYLGVDTRYSARLMEAAAAALLG